MNTPGIDYTIKQTPIGNWVVVRANGNELPGGPWEHETEAVEALRRSEGLPPDDTSLAGRSHVAFFKAACLVCGTPDAVRIDPRGKDIYLKCRAQPCPFERYITTRQ